MKLIQPLLLLYLLLATSCQGIDETASNDFKFLAKKTDKLLSKIDPFRYTDYSYSLKLLDSLEEITTESRLDSSLGKVLFAKAIIYERKALLHRSLDYLDKSEAIFKQANKWAWYHKCLHSKGQIYIHLGAYDSAENYHRKSLLYSIKKEDSGGALRAYVGLSYLKTAIATIDSSLHYAYKALRIANNEKAENKLLDTYGILSWIYMHRNEYDSSLKYKNHFIELTRKMNFKAYFSTSYRLSGDIERVTKKNLTKAKFYYEKMLDEATKYHQVNDEIVAHYRLSEIAFNKNEFEEALNHTSIIKKMVKNIDPTYQIVYGFTQLADIYTELGDKINAISTLSEASELVRKYPYHQGSKVALTKTKMNYYSRFGPYDSLNHYLHAYTKSYDSYEGNMNKRVAKWKTKYETEKKQQEINQLQQQATIHNLQIQQKNIFIIMAVIGIGIAIAFTVFYSRQTKMKALNREAAIEQKLLRTQMNPHFISNALVSIEKFIYENSVDQAGKYLTRFSKLMRRTLENSRMTTISLYDEVETLQHYLELQKLRHGNKFDYEIEVDKKLDLEEVHIPPMFGQPIIENAIEHGLANKEEKGFIKVAFVLEENLLMLKVEDNGIGINESMKLNKHEHHSVSTTIANERIFLMNMINQKKATFEHHDVVDEAKNIVGTKVVFQFPLNIL